MTDPHFQSHSVLGTVVVTVDDSPCGPIRVAGYDGSLDLPSGGSAIVLPVVDTVVETERGLRLQLPAGGYAIVPGGSFVRGIGLTIYTRDYVGLTQAGGPLEAAGRLKYIDGCSDTLLLCPPVVGEPCLNHLHLPPGIDQTRHTHPSDRIGIILRGAGECRTPNGAYPLEAGMFWRIPAGGQHSFYTAADQTLDVFAWHPDSDFGPSHDWHPMLNRTMVDGVSAADDRNRAIRTTDIRA